VERVVAYIDGFNLYRGLKDDHQRKYLWLDLQTLCERLCTANQTLVGVKYFTAAVRNDPGGQARQAIFLAALEAHCPLITITKGRFQKKQLGCRVCGARWTSYEEKETDVSIAVSVVEDAALDRFDTALIVSADSDLCPAVRSARRLRPQSRFIAAFPPKRRSDELRREVNHAFTIGEANLRASLLPNTVNGTLHRPVDWV
jgi:uncharacterized LabA/DUF88 family protein